MFSLACTKLEPACTNWEILRDFMNWEILTFCFLKKLTDGPHQPPFLHGSNFLRLNSGCLLQRRHVFFGAPWALRCLIVSLILRSSVPYCTQNQLLQCQTARILPTEPTSLFGVIWALRTFELANFWPKGTQKASTTLSPCWSQLG